MDRNSHRFQQWMQPQYTEVERTRNEHWYVYRGQVTQDPPPTPPRRPHYNLWIIGGRTLYDGEMIGLSNLDLFEGTSSFDVAVSSPVEAVKIGRRLTGCACFGLVELEGDGEYYEWYDDEGRDIEKIVNGS